jgi:hypothetical protein
MQEAPVSLYIHRLYKINVSVCTLNLYETWPSSDGNVGVQSFCGRFYSITTLELRNLKLAIVSVSLWRTVPVYFIFSEDENLECQSCLTKLLHIRPK